MRQSVYRQLYGHLPTISKQKAAETGLRQCLKVAKDRDKRQQCTVFFIFIFLNEN